MGSSPPPPVPPSPAFLAAFSAHADAAGRMPFARFMDLALYAPDLGYYRQPRARVGYAAGTDFFTASTSGKIFGELLAAAAVTLLGARDPRAFTFVELGAEPGGGVLAGVAHPFAAARTVRLGEPLELAGPLVVFSNELFDAQPFRRFVRHADAWHELGVELRAGALHEVRLAPVAVPALPPAAAAGAIFDAPFAAAALAAQIAAQPWSGLFLACDYGKTFRELAESRPAGTARAYFRHTQSNDLLARPGEQDLTCHVCWDWLADALARHGFAAPLVERQEAFFVHHAAAFVAARTAAEAARFSPEKLALLQLLHPAHLGEKFQVLHAFRPRENSPCLA